MVQKAGDHNLECMKRRDKLQTSICEFLIHQPHTIYVCYIYNVSFYGKLVVGKYLSFMDAVLSEKKVFCLAKIPTANGRNPSGVGNVSLHRCFWMSCWYLVKRIIP